MFKGVKTEFANNTTFSILDHLALELTDYVYWFTNRRIHGSLGYVCPVEYRLKTL